MDKAVKYVLIKVLTVANIGLLVFANESLPTCDITRRSDVKFFDIRLPELEVPSDLTTYVCHTVNIPLPMDKVYHAVAFEPIIVNPEVMHHMILFGCKSAPESAPPHLCGAVDGGCRTFLVQWSMGIKGQICSFPDTGVRFGLDSVQAMSLQIHWNNGNNVSRMVDSSGVRVYYTPVLQKYDVGNLQVGQNDLEIPAGQGHHVHSGSCSSDCTRQWLQQPIYLTRAHIHLHFVGDGGILALVRNGTTVREIVRDDTFDYHNPPAHYFDDPVQVLPGDELKLTCFYNTRDGVKGRNNTVYWGEGSDGEMCYAFITYFPKVDNFDQCIQFDKYDICSPSGFSSLGECVPDGFARYFRTEMVDDILNSCTKDPKADVPVIEVSKICSLDCERAVLQATDHPCMQDRVGKYTIRVHLSKLDSWNKIKVILNAANRHCTD